MDGVFARDDIFDGRALFLAGARGGLLGLGVVFGHCGGMKTGEEVVSGLIVGAEEGLKSRVKTS